jgi:uncharacterized membrane protein (DUF2068 family)
MDPPPGHKHHHRPPPEAVDERTSLAGLRAVATFEGIKGLAVLLLGLGLLSLLHKDVEEAAENLLLTFHIDRDHRLSAAFLRLASKINDRRLWAIFFATLAYATVRFTEGWGLWHRRVWAEWFALLSGALYLPFEIVKVLERPNFWHIGLLVTNIAIVVYMAWVRFLAARPFPD